MMMICEDDSETRVAHERPIWPRSPLLFRPSYRIFTNCPHRWDWISVIRLVAPSLTPPLVPCLFTGQYSLHIPLIAWQWTDGRTDIAPTPTPFTLPRCRRISDSNLVKCKRKRRRAPIGRSLSNSSAHHKWQKNNALSDYTGGGHGLLNPAACQDTYYAHHYAMIKKYQNKW